MYKIRIISDFKGSIGLIQQRLLKQYFINFHTEYCLITGYRIDASFFNFRN